MITPTTFPVSYQSVFRPACFGFMGVEAPEGTDFEIYSDKVSEPLGVKRLWTENEAVVNVAPYLRGAFAPEPLCDQPMGMAADEGREVWCYVASSGYESAAIPLTCGTSDAETNEILSAGPSTVTIRPGERDEISVLAPSLGVKPTLLFRYDGVEYVDSSLPSLLSSGPVTMVVDADAVARSFATLSGKSRSEMTGFTVRLTVEASRDVPEHYLERHYRFIPIPGNGRRLAWVNRYGMVDYYTFPYVGEGRVSGSRTKIETGEGYLTVATREESSARLLSEPRGVLEAEWLAELFSSPLVWLISGKRYERVEVSGGEAVCSPSKPTTVEVKISPAKKTISRKF